MNNELIDKLKETIQQKMSGHKLIIGPDYEVLYSNSDGFVSILMDIKIAALSGDDGEYDPEPITIQFDFLPDDDEWVIVVGPWGDDWIGITCANLFMTMYYKSQAPITQQQEVHPDDIAVMIFAEAMKAKMAASREKGRTGWEDPVSCSGAYLAELLVGHVEKGDPVDIANFCMMIHQRGISGHEIRTAWSDAVSQQQKQEAEPYGYLRENDGAVQLSIGSERPPDRSGGYSTPWAAIYSRPPKPAAQPQVAEPCWDETARRYMCVGDCPNPHTKTLIEQEAEPVTMNDAIAAGDGTLHGAIDYWQERALKAEAALPQVPEGCEWELDDDESGRWTGSCGADWVFYDGGPTENRMNYCPSCGNTLCISAAKEETK